MLQVKGNKDHHSSIKTLQKLRLCRENGVVYHKCSIRNSGTPSFDASLEIARIRGVREQSKYIYTILIQSLDLCLFMGLVLYPSYKVLQHSLMVTIEVAPNQMYEYLNGGQQGVLSKYTDKLKGLLLRAFEQLIFSQSFEARVHDHALVDTRWVNSRARSVEPFPTTVALVQSNARLIVEQ